MGYCCGNVQYGNPSEVGCAGLDITDCTKGECPSSGSVTNAEFAAYGDAALSESSSYDDDYDDAYYEDQAVDRGYNDNENMYNAYNDNQRYYEEDEQFAGNNNKRSNSDDDRNGNNRNNDNGKYSKSGNRNKGYSKSGNRNKGYSKSANNRNSASNNRNHKFAGYGVDATTDDIFNAYEEQQVVAGKKGKSKSSSKSKSKGKGKKKSSSKKKKKKSSSKSKSKGKKKSKSSSKKKHKFAGYGVDATTDDTFAGKGDKGNKDSDSNKDSDEWSSCLCTVEYKPMCCGKGKDKTTYSNKCEARCDGRRVSDECTEGECNGHGDQCQCTNELDVVCCPGEDNEDGEEFANPCTAKCEKSTSELLDCRYGACPHSCACPMHIDEHCCAGKTYDNKCIADCSGVDIGTCVKGKCPEICPLIYKPVCCDGDTEYPSQCEADNDGATGCKGGEWDKLCTCHSKWNPICCGKNNDKTYGNTCNAVCANEDLVQCHYGACKEFDSCDCKKDKKKPVCCEGRDYRNKCLAKCAGEKCDSCDEGECKDQNTPKFSAIRSGLEAIEKTEKHVKLGPVLLNVNFNTVLLGLILVAIASFICVYYKRSVRFKKEQAFDESDQ